MLIIFFVEARTRAFSLVINHELDHFVRNERAFPFVLSSPITVNCIRDLGEPCWVFRRFKDQRSRKVFHAVGGRVAERFQEFGRDESRNIVIAAIEEPGDLLRGEPGLRLPQHSKESAFHVVHVFCGGSLVLKHEIAVHKGGRNCFAKADKQFFAWDSGKNCDGKLLPLR